MCQISFASNIQSLDWIKEGLHCMVAILSDLTNLAVGEILVSVRVDLALQSCSSAKTKCCACSE